MRDPIERIRSDFIYNKFKKKGYDTSPFFSPSNEYQHIKDLDELVSVWHSLEEQIITNSRILGDTVNLVRCSKNIFFAGRMEHLEEDFMGLQRKLGLENKFKLSTSYTNTMPKKLEYMKKISKKSKEKLRGYLNAEYENISWLANNGFLPMSYLDEINYKL